MTYNPPELSALLAHAKELEAKSKTDTLAHQQLAEMLASVARHVEANVSDKNRDAMHKTLLGAYLFVSEKIKQEYVVHSARFSTGKFYNSGSPLYSYLAGILKQKNNRPTAREHLIFINHFHQFAKLPHDSVIETKNLVADITKMLSIEFNKLTNEIAKIVNAVPTEQAVTTHMDQLPEGYSTAKQNAGNSLWSSKQNENRVFLTQLAKAVAAIPCEDDVDLPEKSFTRSQRIKLGAMLYIKNIIKSEYFVRSPSNSELYRLARKILNMTTEDNLNDIQKIACLEAFKSYLHDTVARDRLEKFGQQHFGKQSQLTNIDGKATLIIDDVNSMQHRLKPSFFRRWPCTSAGIGLGTVFGSAPGYSFGYAFGVVASSSSAARPASSVVGNGVSRLATVYFGPSSSAARFSLAIGDFLFQQTLIRAFAKIFELAGMMVGGAAGGVVGFTVDLTYKGYKDFCVKVLNHYDQHPDKMSATDRELLETLYKLPQAVFEPDLKAKLRYAEGTELDQTPKPDDADPTPGQSASCRA